MLSLLLLLLFSFPFVIDGDFDAGFDEDLDGDFVMVDDFCGLSTGPIFSDEESEMQIYSSSFKLFSRTTFFFSFTTKLLAFVSLAAFLVSDLEFRPNRI